MHVAFGRVRRKSRISADSTDDADFGGFCLPSVFVRRAGLGRLSVSERKLKVYGTEDDCLNRDLREWGTCDESHDYKRFVVSC